MAKKEFKFDGLIKQAEKQNQQSADYIRQHISILDDLQKFIPPLSSEEFEQLADNIRREGCRDALVVWEKNTDKTVDYVLIDGHNRFKICNSLGISFKVEVRNFENIDAVKEWMINNQLGKRNVSEETKAYLRGLQYRNEKRKTGGTGANQFAKSEKTERTAEKLAEVHQVSEKTIRTDEKFADAIDKIAADNENLKWKLLNREIKFNKTDLMNLSTENDQFFEHFATALTTGKDFKDAITAAKPTTKTNESIQKDDKGTTSQHFANLSELPAEIVELKAQIAKALNEVLKKKNRNAMNKLKKYVQELEKTLFE